MNVNKFLAHAAAGRLAGAWGSALPLDSLVSVEDDKSLHMHEAIKPVDKRIGSTPWSSPNFLGADLDFAMNERLKT